MTAQKPAVLTVYSINFHFGPNRTETPKDDVPLHIIWARIQAYRPLRKHVCPHGCGDSYIVSVPPQMRKDYGETLRYWARKDDKPDWQLNEVVTEDLATAKAWMRAYLLAQAERAAADTAKDEEFHIRVRGRLQRLEAVYRLGAAMEDYPVVDGFTLLTFAS